MPLADHLIVLEQGRLLAAGAPQEVAAAVRGHAIFFRHAHGGTHRRRPRRDGVSAAHRARGQSVSGALCSAPDAGRGARARGHAPVLTVRDGWFRYAQGSADVLRNFSLTLRRAGSSTRSPAATAAARRRRSACSPDGCGCTAAACISPGRSSARSSPARRHRRRAAGSAHALRG